MFDFSRAPIWFLVPIPLLVLIVIGQLTVVGGVGWLVWHFILSHLSWVG